MSAETIQAGNKLIAEFMGYDTCTDPDHADNKCYQVPYAKGYHRLHQMQHHSSWDWICPVMEKICQMGYTVQWTITDGSTCRIWAHLKTVPPCGVIITDRPFTAIVQFITWYNSTTELSKP